MFLKVLGTKNKSWVVRSHDLGNRAALLNISATFTSCVLQTTDETLKNTFSFPYMDLYLYLNIITHNAWHFSSDILSSVKPTLTFFSQSNNNEKNSVVFWMTSDVTTNINSYLFMGRTTTFKAVAFKHCLSECYMEVLFVLPTTFTKMLKTKSIMINRWVMPISIPTGWARDRRQQQEYLTLCHLPVKLGLYFPQCNLSVTFLLWLQLSEPWVSTI